MTILVLILLLLLAYVSVSYYREYQAHEHDIKAADNNRTLASLALLCLIRSEGAKDAAKDYVDAIFGNFQSTELQFAINNMTKSLKWTRDFDFSNEASEKKRLIEDLTQSFLKFSLNSPLYGYDDN